MPTYYAAGHSPLALPLGELSPQVTERVLQPFSNDKINLCTHITEILVVRGVSSPCEAAGHFLIEHCLLVWSLVALSVLATLGHLSQRERQGKLSYPPCRLAGGILCLNRKDRPAPWWHRRSGPAPPGGPPDTRSTPGRRSWPRCRRRGSEAAGTGDIRPCRRPAADRSG